MRFAEKLRRYVADKNISYAELERMGVGVSGATIARWAKDEGDPELKIPRINQLAGLAKATGLPVAYWADETIRRPGDMGGEAGLSAVTRANIEKTRTLGEERAGYILDTVIQLGAQEAIARLLLQRAPAPAEGGEEPGQKGVKVVGGHVETGNPSSADHPITHGGPAKRVRRQ